MDDERLFPLLQGCARDEHFDLDTSDVGAILVATLERGQRDALHRARVELAFGPPADRERVAELFARRFQDPHAEPVISNALDVALLADDDVLDDTLRRALEHPSEQIRIKGLQGIRAGGRPEDFELVMARIATRDYAEFKDAALALPATDAARAEAVLADWLLQGEHELCALLAREFARAETEELQGAVRSVLEDAARPFSPSLEPYLVAGLLDAAEPGPTPFDAAARFEALLGSPDPAVRSAAIDAAAVADRWADVDRRIDDETDPKIRLRALNLRLAGPDGEALRGRLTAALDAHDPELRALALGALAERGDPNAVDRAVALVEQRGAQRSQGMQALRPLLQTEMQLPEDARPLTTRLFSILARELASAVQAEVASKRSLMQALGGLGSAEAARLLIAEARVARGEIARMDARRWILLQVSNGGEPAHRVLREELAAETHPVRRLDLLEALTAPGGELARETGMALLQIEPLDPFEALYVASRLIAVGPARTVLPLLKRVCLRVEEPRARRAFQCLLWQAYPR